MKLLKRDEFREMVFERDGHACVVCGMNAVDAHHIIERRVWSDEGYYLENGASLCENHHRLAERGFIDPIELWQLVGSEGNILPPKLDPLNDWDKWGNPHKMPTRKNIKYPSINYFPFSPSQYEKKEDVDLKNFANVPLVITEKMDGSNAKLTHELVASRNGAHAEHKSFDMLKARHAEIKNLIPQDVIVFGEWLYAKHSIEYDELKDYFQVFAVYGMNSRMFKPWATVEAIAQGLGFPTVQVVARLETSLYVNEHEASNKLFGISQKVIDKGGEGIVVRYSGSFHYSNNTHFMGKSVRENHVQTDTHWMHQTICRNKLKGSD